MPPTKVQFRLHKASEEAKTYMRGKALVAENGFGQSGKRRTSHAEPVSKFEAHVQICRVVGSEVFVGCQVVQPVFSLVLKNDLVATLACQKDFASEARCPLASKCGNHTCLVLGQIQFEASALENVPDSLQKVTQRLR